jgi:putative transposase
VLHRLLEPKQYTSIRLTEHLDLEDIRLSIGSIGDAYDCEDDGRSAGGLTLAYD